MGGKQKQAGDGWVVKWFDIRARIWRCAGSNAAATVEVCVCNDIFQFVDYIVKLHSVLFSSVGTRGASTTSSVGAGKGRFVIGVVWWCLVKMMVAFFVVVVVLICCCVSCLLWRLVATADSYWTAELLTITRTLVNFFSRLNRESCSIFWLLLAFFLHSSIRKTHCSFFSKFSLFLS